MFGIYIFVNLDTPFCDKWKPVAHAQSRTTHLHEPDAALLYWCAPPIEET